MRLGETSSFDCVEYSQIVHTSGIVHGHFQRILAGTPTVFTGLLARDSSRIVPKVRLSAQVSLRLLKLLYSMATHQHSAALRYATVVT